MISAKAYLGSVFMRTMTVKLKIVDAAVHPDYENINAHDIALLVCPKPGTYRVDFMIVSNDAWCREGKLIGLILSVKFTGFSNFKRAIS